MRELGKNTNTCENLNEIIADLKKSLESAGFELKTKIDGFAIFEKPKGVSSNEFTKII